MVSETLWRACTWAGTWEVPTLRMHMTWLLHIQRPMPLYVELPLCPLSTSCAKCACKKVNSIVSLVFHSLCQGDGVARCIKTAMKNAGVEPEEVPHWALQPLGPCTVWRIFNISQSSKIIQLVKFKTHSFNCCESFLKQSDSLDSLEPVMPAEPVMLCKWRSLGGWLLELPWYVHSSWRHGGGGLQNPISFEFEESDSQRRVI